MYVYEQLLRPRYAHFHCFAHLRTDSILYLAFLSYMRDARHPVTAPFQLPIYSDSGFFILGRVLERLTGLSYNEALQKVLGTPLALEDSSTFEPTGPEANGLALPGNISVSAWGYDNQVTAP